MGSVDAVAISAGVIAPDRLGTGSALQVVRQNAANDALEFASVSGGSGDALVANTLDQFADVTQTAGQTLAITSSTTLSGGTHSGTNTGDNSANSLYSGLVSNATHTGDVTGATALTIANDAVTYGKMQNVSAASRLLGRGSAGGSGDVEELSVGSGLSLSGTTLSATGGGGGNCTLTTGDITTTTSSSNSVWSAITGAGVSVVAGNTYIIEWNLRTYSAAATTGLGLRRALADSAAGTFSGFHYRGQSNASAVTAQSSREGTIDQFIGTGNATSSTTVSGSYMAKCKFVCGTSGTINLEMRSEVNASLVTVAGDGSYWWAQAIAS